MQEEVENRTVNFAVSTTKLTARTILTAFQKYQRYRSSVKAQKKAERAAKEKAAAEAVPHGKQTVKELIGQNQGVANIDIAKTDLRGFERIANRYGVDYAIRKDLSVQPPKYLVFFKARDGDAMTAAFREYSTAIMRRKEKSRPSVLKQLKKLKALVASMPEKVRNKEKEHTL